VPGNSRARISAFLICSALLIAEAVQAQNRQPVPIYSPNSGQVNIKPPGPQAPDPESSSSCTLITFEGLGDLAAIPTFEGISFPGWLSIISDTVGGDGNFANAPGGDTIAFWLYGNPTSQNILIPNGASSVSFYYSSYYPITLSAYDSNGNLLNSASGPANFDFGTYVYDIWSPLQVNSSQIYLKFPDQWYSAIRRIG
jgi:hypothetical protein